MKICDEVLRRSVAKDGFNLSNEDRTSGQIVAAIPRSETAIPVFLASFPLYLNIFFLLLLSVHVSPFLSPLLYSFVFYLFSFFCSSFF